MSFSVIKLCLLMLAFIPLLISNLRTGMVKNGLLLAMFGVGVLVAFFGPSFGAQPLKLSALLGWLLVAGLLLGMTVYGVIPGGVAKFLMAILPWFPFGEYLLVVTMGMFSTAGIGLLATEKRALVVPPMMSSAFAVGLLPILGFEPF